MSIPKALDKVTPGINERYDLAIGGYLEVILGLKACVGSLVGHFGSLDGLLEALGDHFGSLEGYLGDLEGHLGATKAAKGHLGRFWGPSLWS